MSTGLVVEDSSSLGGGGGGNHSVLPPHHNNSTHLQQEEHADDNTFDFIFEGFFLTVVTFFGIVANLLAIVILLRKDFKHQSDRVTSLK